jgi:hypothetical protein
MNAPTGPAFSFDGGVLSIDTNLARMRIQWLPKPQAEELAPGGRRWRAFWPEFRLIRPEQGHGKRTVYTLDLPADHVTEEVAKQKALAFAAFRDQIPAETVRVVEPFGSHQWALMVLLHEQPRALDLAGSNPVLAYALANSDQLRGTRPEAAAVQALWYCNRKQRVLLEWLGFPGSEALVRLVRKIPPGSASPSVLRRLKNAVVADKRVLELLTHLRVVNATALELVTNQRLLDLVTPKLLLEVSAQDDTPGEPSAGDMILGSMTILRDIAPRREIKPFSSVEQARRFHEETDAEYQAHLRRQDEAKQEAQRVAEEERRRQREEAQARRRRKREWRAEVARRPYPKPPVPGTRDIVPLTSAEQLQIEGAEQCNCVASYAWRVLQGGTYIYRVMAPERATLAIVRGADGCWRRSELKAKSNRKVRASTVALVDRWLTRYCVSV